MSRKTNAKVGLFYIFLADLFILALTSFVIALFASFGSENWLKTAFDKWLLRTPWGALIVLSAAGALALITKLGRTCKK
mgnify:CR=1 FL=1